ncbi:hypothetical protein ZHAS_00015688 [Anopheles sinensis]|uniref:Uncharacterized protein n=1 Tax=Anopheles sinensis TaxID=74873 RepID=A0A084WBQ2_ANOSI|nr:hypothetical protein ZHAS_00015688 [Anopheles sinensis]
MGGVIDSRCLPTGFPGHPKHADRLSENATGLRARLKVIRGEKGAEFGGSGRWYRGNWEVFVYDMTQSAPYGVRPPAVVIRELFSR